MTLSLPDRIACHLGIWALRRLYGECATDLAETHHGAVCVGCDATRMIKGMREILGTPVP